MREDHVELHARVALVLGQLEIFHDFVGLADGRHVELVQLQVGDAVHRHGRCIVTLVNLREVFLAIVANRVRLQSATTATAVVLEVAQASRVVAASLLELLNAFEVVNEPAELERRRVIKMVTLEVAINLLGQDGLGHLRTAVEAAQRLDIEHDVGLLVAHLLERLDEHVLAAANHYDLIHELHIEHCVARNGAIFLGLGSLLAKQRFLERVLSGVHSFQSDQSGYFIVEVLLGPTARIQRLSTRSLGQERLFDVYRGWVVLSKRLIDDIFSFYNVAFDGNDFLRHIVACESLAMF